MNNTILLAFLLPLWASSAAATESQIRWPDAIGQLAKIKSQAQACVNLLKTTGNKTAIVYGQITYGSAKASADGVIAGLTVALVVGGKPADLANLTQSLEKAGVGLQDVCNTAIKAAEDSIGSRGFVDDIVKEAIGPVVDALKSAIGALWTRHVENSKLEIETIKSQLEKATWPEFG